MVGSLIYYRYINSGIVAPDAFDVVTVGPGEQLTNRQRRNLATIAKTLQAAATKRGSGLHGFTYAKFVETVKNMKNSKLNAFLFKTIKNMKNSKLNAFLFKTIKKMKNSKLNAFLFKSIKNMKN